MAIETDVSELRARQKAKAKRNFLIKLFIVIIVAVIAVVAVFTKNLWYPYLDGILKKVPSTANVGIGGNAVLAEGEFPLSINNGSDYQMKAMDDYLAIIDDSHFFVYDTDGSEVKKVQHSYSNPILTVSDKKALIYDLGGNGFSLESKYKSLYSLSCENTILLAELSTNDCVAVVTKSDKYLSLLDVYNAKGAKIFTYKSYDGRIIDVTFLSDNSGVILTILSASDGMIKSELLKLKFDSLSAEWRSDSTSALAVDASIDENNSIVLFGDTKCSYVNDSGIILAEHEYGDDLLDYASSSELAAVLLENSALRKYTLMLVSSNNCTEAVYAELPEAARHIAVKDKMVYVLTGSGIYTYNNMGLEVSGVNLTDSYDNFCPINGYMFLLGYDEINRIDFSG
ncbi:MAG: hypothetical protein IJ446_00345 [Oscillospiraceae bacterium]|nr:hypothetical protein [Oscillospiraceae bacterium]